MASEAIDAGIPGFTPRGKDVLKGAACLVRTAIPIAAVGLVNLAMTITDAAMMADIDPRALAAGAIIGDIYSIFIQFAAGALSAYTPRIAAACGNRDSRLAGMVTGEGVRTAIVMGVAGAILIAAVPAALLTAGMALPLPEAAQSYAGYMAATFAFMMIVALARNVFPAMDFGSLPVYVLLAAVPLNGLLNAILMYGWFGLPAMGLAGAGASSMAVAAFMAVLFAAFACLAPRLKGIRIVPNALASRWFPEYVPPREMFLVGGVALCETGVFLLSTMMIGFYEMEAVASHIAVFRTVAITYTIATGVGQAITIHAARAGGDAYRFRTLEWSALLVAVAGGPLVMATVNFVPASIFAVMDMDGSRISEIAPYAGISVFAIVPALVIRGFLRAIPDSFAPAIIGFFGYWCAGFPAMLYLAGPAGYGASGVWSGLAAGTTVTAAALIAYYSWRKFLERRTRPVISRWLALPAPAGE